MPEFLGSQKIFTCQAILPPLANKILLYLH
ncbi:hypothetical protein CPL00229_CDS0175 [Escherichia phage vB_Eco_mar004NP2]